MSGWTWRRYTRGSQPGKIIPGVVITTRHTVLIDDMADMLSHHAVSTIGDLSADLPTLTPGQTEKIIREFLKDHGSRGLESIWSDDLTTDESDRISAWARDQVRAAWPEQAQHV